MTRNKPHNNQLCADLSRLISDYPVVSHFLRFAWQTTKEQTPQAPQETEYNYLLRRKEAKENNEKSETYDITKNAFYIAEDEVIDKGEDLFRRKEQ